jgi:hypothetical protein
MNKPQRTRLVPMGNVPTEAKRRMVRAARDALLQLHAVAPPPCVIALTRDGWDTVLGDAGLDDDTPLLEAEFTTVLETADSTPQRLGPVASDLVAAVELVAHDLWCIHAFQPADPDHAWALRERLIDAVVSALDVAAGYVDAAELAHAREAVAVAVAALRDVATAFVFPTDECEAAFGIPRVDVVDERDIFSSSRLLAAYYGRYQQLAIRIGTLLSVITSRPPDFISGLGPAEALALSGRPLITLRTAVRITRLFEEHIAADVDALARPMREMKLSVDRSATSHGAVLRLLIQRGQASTAEEKAVLGLDIYRRMVEGQLRPWGWALLQVFGRTAAKQPELSSLREQLVAEHHPLLLDAARAILPEARNAAAHEDYLWDHKLGVLRIGDAEISPDDLDDASDRAYTFMLGAEAAWRCARHSSTVFANALDADDPDGGFAALNVRRAIEHFGTNGLQVQRWSLDGGTLTVVLDDLPFQRINPCFQAVVWASRHLEGTERFVVTTPGAERPAMDLPRAPLDANFIVWWEVASRFPYMPLSAFMPANTWARLAVELPDAAARASAWHGLNDAVHAYNEAMDAPGPLDQRLGTLVDRLDVVTTAVAATIATLPEEAVSPLSQVLELTRSAATATSAVIRGLSSAPAAQLEEQIRALYESWPSASVLPTVDPRPLDVMDLTGD